LAALLCRSGGTGRRAGLKIPCPLRGVWVRPPPPAPLFHWIYATAEPLTEVRPKSLVSVVVSLGFSIRSSTTSCKWVGARCEYRTVMVIVLRPKSSCTERRSTLAITRRLAKVCRRSCQWKLLMPAERTASSNLRCQSHSRSPSTPAKILPGAGRRCQSISSALRAAELIGT